MAKYLIHKFIYINQLIQVLIVELQQIIFSDDCTAIDGQVY
jgi:hypothetical protein